MNNIKTAQSIAHKIRDGHRDFGRVAIKQDDEYFLLNYTQDAMWGGNMTRIEKACRGLVVRSDGKIMALPMSKFFNLGEPQCPSLPDEPYTVWEKIDGSLVIFWHDGGKWRCNTRGSFDNEYVDFALAWWNGRWGMDDVPKHWTVMGEVCFEDDPMPRAAYKHEGVYTIAVRDRYSGIDLQVDLERVFSHLSDMLFAERVEMSINQLLGRRGNLEGQEGWVIRYESGLRIKVKTAWYLRVFRALSSLTPKRIRDLMVAGDQNWIDVFPDDLQAEALAIQERLESDFRSKLAKIYDAYSRVAKIETRKDYALTVLAEYPNVSHWLFKLKDNKFEELDVLKSLTLTN